MLRFIAAVLAVLLSSVGPLLAFDARCNHNAYEEVLCRMVQHTTSRNTLLPAGVPRHYDWYRGGRIWAGNSPPKGFDWVMPWGTIYPAQASRFDARAVISIRKLHLYALSRATGRWEAVSCNARAVSRLYVADFKGNSSLTDSTQYFGRDALSAHLAPNHNLHFYLDDRVKLPRSQFGGLIVSYEAKIEPGSGSDTAVVANSGIDYWSSRTAPWAGTGVNNRDAFVGSFVPLTDQYQTIYGTTLSLRELRQFPPPLEQLC
jgi:hypothetical protein